MPDYQNNTVDGIKKMSGAELEKSRKIVLETIGENFKTNISETPVIDSQSNKMIDSLAYKNDRAEPKNNALEKKDFKLIDNLKTKLKILDVNQNQLKITNQPVKNYAPDFKNIRPLVDELLNKKEPVEKKIESPKESVVAKTISKNNLKSSPANNKIAQFKINPKKIKFKFLKYFDDFSDFLSAFLYKVKNIYIYFISNFLKISYIVLISFFSFVFIYLIFIFLVIKLNIDNKFFRLAENILPIPAIIYDGGIINYYSYKDLKINYSIQYLNKNLSSLELKNLIIRNIIFNQLLKKYKITDETEIFPIMISDIEVNQVAINRIKKIKNMINSDEDFLPISEKYGDEQGKKIFSQNEFEGLKYKNKIENLAVGEISGIIAQPEGYYIYRLNQKTENFRGFNYIFVKAVTLDDYLNKEAKIFKYFSLVD